jgi:hypothetical protein
MIDGGVYGSRSLSAPSGSRRADGLISAPFPPGDRSLLSRVEPGGFEPLTLEYFIQACCSTLLFRVW